jgi:3-oxoacyl-[acyl-carrier protein] reductase
MDLGIAGRIAVVTGGGKGIGAETVALLRAEGAQVLDASRSTGIDIKQPDAADRIRAALDGAEPDILVNNAGAAGVRTLDELTDEEWQEQWDLNVTGPRRLMQAFAPAMAERGWGRIVNVTSSSGKRPAAWNAAYSVAKAAQLSLSRAYADAYAGRGVLVNAIAPGATNGPFWLQEGGLADQNAAKRGISRDEVLAATASRVPLGRMLEPEEIASVVVFLCSARASAVLGAAWSVDGGAVATIV